jgi:hypothetical protein
VCLGLTILYEIGDIGRFPTVKDFLSYCRLGERLDGRGDFKHRMAQRDTHSRSCSVSSLRLSKLGCGWRLKAERVRGRFGGDAKRNMNRSNLIVAGLVLAGATIEGGLAQTPPAQPIQPYALLQGSQLIDECPICGRVPITVPMAGTMGLRLVEKNPLFARYELLSIAFRAGSEPGPHYQVMGSGTYQVGGEKVIVQEMSLDLQIDNGVTKTLSFCTNAVGTVDLPWPEIQISVDQTNGTPAQLYHLKLVAAPALQFLSIMPELQTGNLRLEWEGNGGQVRLERAENVDGPYSALTPITTDQAFEDVGVLTNRTRYFYRLRQY